MPFRMTEKSEPPKCIGNSYVAMVEGEGDRGGVLEEGSVDWRFDNLFIAYTTIVRQSN